MSALSNAARQPEKSSTRLWVNLAMFSAVSLVVTYLSKLIPISIVGFLHFDFKDAVIVIAGFLFGPLPAVAVVVVVSFIEMLAISATGPIGMIMNIVASCAFACPAAIIYKHDRSMKGAVIGLVSGALAMTAMMLLWNYLITPLYMKIARETVAAMLLPVFLPFNLIKSGMNVALTLIVYKPFTNVLRRAHLIEAHSSGNADCGSRRLGVLLAGLAMLVTSILLALVLAGKI